MAKLFVITGHGAGDSGATGNGYTEAERVRALAQRVKALGGDNVLVSEPERNYYKDNGITNLTISKEYKIVELHMDSSSSASAKGGHVIIKAGLSADEYDKKLAEFISTMFPGRSTIIQARNDLANPRRAYAKGYNYRLVECGFISNAEDVNIFNSKIDDLARGILESFGISEVAKPSTSTSQATNTTSKSLDDWAREVINGKHGTGHDNRAKSLANSGCQYDYQTVRNRVNELCGVKTNTTATKPQKTLDEWAREVINGKHGTGHANREKSLKKAGCPYAYSQVRARVNALCK